MAIFVSVKNNLLTSKNKTIMKTKELKKLSSEFSEFLSESGSTNIEGVMSEFWSAKFGVNNKEREAELLEYWKAN